MGEVVIHRLNIRDIQIMVRDTLKPFDLTLQAFGEYTRNIPFQTGPFPDPEGGSFYKEERRDVPAFTVKLMTSMSDGEAFNKAVDELVNRIGNTWGWGPVMGIAGSQDKDFIAGITYNVSDKMDFLRYMAGTGGMFLRLTFKEANVDRKDEDAFRRFYVEIIISGFAGFDITGMQNDIWVPDEFILGLK